MITKKRVLYLFLGVLAIMIFIPNTTNNIRYKIEKRFAEPLTFFYNCGIGVKEPEPPYYDNQIYFDESNSNTIHLNLSKYNNYEVYLYGEITNSNDPLVVILNDVINDNSNRNIHDNGLPMFWKRYYLEKSFVVQLNGFHDGNNELIFITGNALERYNIIVD